MLKGVRVSESLIQEELPNHHWFEREIYCLVLCLLRFLRLLKKVNIEPAISWVILLLNFVFTFWVPIFWATLFKGLMYLTSNLIELSELICHHIVLLDSTEGSLHSWGLHSKAIHSLIAQLLSVYSGNAEHCSGCHFTRRVTLLLLYTQFALMSC